MLAARLRASRVGVHLTDALIRLELSRPVPRHEILIWFRAAVSDLEDGLIKLDQKTSEQNHMELLWHRFGRVYLGSKMVRSRSGQKRCPNEAIWIKSDIALGM